MDSHQSVEPNVTRRGGFISGCRFLYHLRRSCTSYIKNSRWVYKKSELLCFNFSLQDGKILCVRHFLVMNTRKRDLNIMKGRLRLITRHRLFSLSPFIISLAPFRRTPTPNVTFTLLCSLSHLSPFLSRSMASYVCVFFFVSFHRSTLIQPPLYNSHPPLPFLPVAIF